MADPVERFAAAAGEYRDWVRAGSEAGSPAARRALELVTRVYLAALALPPHWQHAGGANELPPADRFDACRTLAARLPCLIYWEVFDPLLLDPEPPVAGDLADDLADVFHELNDGLRFYAAGLRDEAVWQWGFGFVHHWGGHATSAIRALHCWLATEHPDRLSADDGV